MKPCFNRKEFTRDFHHHFIGLAGVQGYLDVISENAWQLNNLKAMTLKLQIAVK